MRQNKASPIFELDKLPAEVILKEALTELGKQNAYVTELEEKVKELELIVEKKTPSLSQIDNLQKQVDALKKNLESCRVRLRHAESINQIYQKQELDDYKNRSQQQGSTGGCTDTDS